jgi:hypothetical protein
LFLLVIEDILQGRVQSPTGGESPRIRQLADRSGVIPGPTVKVWMEEEFLVDCTLFWWQSSLIYNSRPVGSLQGFLMVNNKPIREL